MSLTGDKQAQRGPHVIGEHQPGSSQKGEESLPFMAAPGTLEEITLFVFAGKAARTPAWQGQTGPCSPCTRSCTGGILVFTEVSVFSLQRSHLFGLFLTKRKWDVCGVVLNYPCCMGKNRAEPALERKYSVFPPIFGNVSQGSREQSVTSPRMLGALQEGSAHPPAAGRLTRGRETQCTCGKLRQSRCLTQSSNSSPQISKQL